MMGTGPDFVTRMREVPVGIDASGILRPDARSAVALVECQSQEAGQCIPFGCGESGELVGRGEELVLHGLQGDVTLWGESNRLDPPVARGRPAFGVAGSFEVVDHGGDVGGIAVHGQRELAHGSGLVRVDGEQST